jgi:hypothetical protein
MTDPSEPTVQPIAPACRCVPEGAFAGLMVVVTAATAPEAITKSATSASAAIANIRFKIPPFFLR